MSEKDEKIFQWSSKCWICDKLFDAGDNKVRDLCHVRENIEFRLIVVVILISGWLKTFLSYYIISRVMTVI